MKRKVLARDAKLAEVVGNFPPIDRNKEAGEHTPKRTKSRDMATRARYKPLWEIATASWGSDRKGL